MINRLGNKNQIQAKISGPREKFWESGDLDKGTFYWISRETGETIL